MSSYSHSVVVVALSLLCWVTSNITSPYSFICCERDVSEASDAVSYSLLDFRWPLMTNFVLFFMYHIDSAASRLI